MNMEVDSISDDRENIRRGHNSDAEEGELVDDSDGENGPPTTWTHHQSGQSLKPIEEKLIRRAQRFGIPIELHQAAELAFMQKIHASMGVDINTRTEALHLYGTDCMKTQDVFAYFERNAPASIEWISEKTCNAVWLDEKSCAQALTNHSSKIKGQGSGHSDSEDEGALELEDLRCALPPGGIWRKGYANRWAPNLFIRYATRYDRRENRPPIHKIIQEVGVPLQLWDQGDEAIKKVRVDDTSDNPWVDIARQWGRYDRISERGKVRDARELIGSRKNQFERELITYSRAAAHNDRIPPLPRERDGYGVMAADIEERRALKRRFAGREIDLREKLGVRRGLRGARGPTDPSEAKRQRRSMSLECDKIVIEVENSGPSSAESSDDEGSGSSSSSSSSSSSDSSSSSSSSESSSSSSSSESEEEDVKPNVKDIWKGYNSGDSEDEEDEEASEQIRPKSKQVKPTTRHKKPSDSESRKKSSSSRKREDARHRRGRERVRQVPRRPSERSPNRATRRTNFEPIQVEIDNDYYSRNKVKTEPLSD